MKLHKGAVLDDLYRHITGNVLGGGMSGDEIVAAISKYGYLFDSSAPVAIPVDIGRADTLGGPWPSGHTFTFEPVSMGFPNQSVPYTALVTFTIFATNSGATPPSVYPPMIQVSVAVGGCVSPGTPNESYSAYVSQSNPGAGGEEDAHRAYSFTMLCGIEDCGTGGVDFTVTIDDVVAWLNWGDISWDIIANAMIVVEG